jgi:hypothetical protein
MANGKSQMEKPVWCAQGRTFMRAAKTGMDSSALRRQFWSYLD